jgi:hypothetical protein
MLPEAKRPWDEWATVAKSYPASDAMIAHPEKAAKKEMQKCISECLGFFSEKLQQASASDSDSSTAQQRRIRRSRRARNAPKKDRRKSKQKWQVEEVDLVKAAIRKYRHSKQPWRLALRQCREEDPTSFLSRTSTDIRDKYRHLVKIGELSSSGSSDSEMDTD